MSKDDRQGTLCISERGGKRCGGGESGEDGRKGEIHQPNQQNNAESATIESRGAGVSTGLREVSGAAGSSTSRIRKLPSWFIENGKSLDERYFESIEERCSRALNVLQRSSGQLVRDVFRFESDAEFKNFVRIFQNHGNHKRGLYQLCLDGDHVHVTHDCSWSNGMCRCNWWQKAKTFGLDARRDKPGFRRCYSRSRTLADISDLLIYYCAKGRKLLYQEIGGRVERLPDEGYSLQEGEITRLSVGKRQVESSVHGDGSEFRQEGLIFQDDEPDARPSGREPQRKKRKLGAFEKIQIRVVEMCERYPIAPPEAVTKITQWLTDPVLKFKNIGDREIKSAVSNFTQQLVSWSMEDYQKMYNKPDSEPVP